MDLIHHSVQKAKKEYHDDLYHDVVEWRKSGCWVGKTCLDKSHLTFSEYRTVLTYLARPKPQIIKKGESYVRQFSADGGDTWTFRCNEEIFKIYSKYKLFNDY